MRRQAALLLGLIPLVGLLAMAAWGAEIRFVGPIYDGPELDYQPTIIRIQPTGQLMVVFERIDLANFYGDLLVTFSNDNGVTWSVPEAIVDSDLNERHPSLIQVGDDSFVLSYLVDETGSGSYRIHRATSTDGLTWIPQGRLELGWATPGEINPNVIREQDGSLTMVYHRLSGPSYIARSVDDGANWDTLMTQVSNGNAQLPRLAKRESDGLYIVTYQVGSTDLDLYAKITSDPYDWSVPQIPVSTAINTHDSQPIVLEDGTFLVPFARQVASVFDLYYRTSCDGTVWSDEVQVTFDPTHYDTQPHPLLQGQLGHIILTWSHQQSVSPYQDHDVWVNSDLLVEADLSGSDKEVAPSYFVPGLSLSYTLTLPNDGPGPAVAWLTDTVPTSTTLQIDSLWSSEGQIGFDPATATITWTGIISACGQVILGFEVDSDPGLAAGESVSNTAQLSYGDATPLELTAVATAEEPITGLIAGNDGPSIVGHVTTLTATIATGSHVSYTWAFGDRELGSGAVVTHTYPSVGIYTAVITASNQVSLAVASTTVVVRPNQVYLPVALISSG
jgi:uncharacterized repeat protein (TIGR01451 family)